jgi:hypothetical protein
MDEEQEHASSGGGGGIWSRISHMPKIQLIGIAVAIGTLVIGFLAYRAMQNSNATGVPANAVPFSLPGTGTATGSGTGAVDTGGAVASPNPPVPASNPPVDPNEHRTDGKGWNDGPHGILSFVPDNSNGGVFGPSGAAFTAPGGGPASPTFTTPHAEPNNPTGNGGFLSLPAPRR